MANGWGGRRTGAGGKPRGIKHLTTIQLAEGQIKKRFPEIVDVVLSAACDNREWKAAEYLINRILGKPAASLHISSDDDPKRVPLDQARELVRVRHRPPKI